MCLLKLELMCWPLTRQWRPHSDDKGDREAAATWRAGWREAEECPRKTTRSFATCGHDRRSPPVESQGDGRMRTGTGPETTSWSSLITSTAWQSRLNGRGETVLFRETEATKPVRQDGRESTSRLRCHLEPDALFGQPATMHPSRWSLNAVERRTALARLPGVLHHCHEKRDQHQR